MMHRAKKTLALVLSLAMAGGLWTAALAQPTHYPPPQLPYPGSTISTSGTLSIEELERRVAQEGLYVTKMEIRDLLLKVDGFDSEHRKVKLHIDRRTGEILSREYKLGKHGRFGKRGGYLPNYGQRVR